MISEFRRRKRDCVYSNTWATWSWNVASVIRWCREVWSRTAVTCVSSVAADTGLSSPSCSCRWGRHLATTNMPPPSTRHKVGRNGLKLVNIQELEGGGVGNGETDLRNKYVGYVTGGCGNGCKHTTVAIVRVRLVCHCCAFGRRNCSKLIFNNSANRQ